MASLLTFLSYVFQPTIDALFARGIPFHLRWRMLLLQPLNIITITLVKLPYLFNPPFKVTSIPNRHGQALRALLYTPERRKPDQLSPLHISFHAGAFIGGFPECQARFNTLLLKKLGCVVVAPHYRYAPKHVFPAGLEDAEDVVKWCMTNCERLWGADPRLVTTDGFSAGGNFAVAVAQDATIRKSLIATVTFYGVMELRVHPKDKPQSEAMPKNDPMRVFLPLFDSYPGPVRAANMTNPRMSPILAEVEQLPPRMLMIVPSIDILVHEQLTLAERASREIAERDLDKSEGRMCEAKVIEGAFHGMMELPYLPKNLADKREFAFNVAIEHLKETYLRHGWHWSED